MKILFALNRYQKVGGEDLAAKVEMELVERHGHTVDVLAVDNAEIVGFDAKVKAALGTVYSSASRKRLAARLQSFRPDIVHVFNFFPLLSPSIYYTCREVGVPVIQKISNFRLICPNALLLRDGHICEDCVGKTVPWPGILHGCYRGSRVGSAVVATMLATHRLLGTWGKLVDAYIARTRFGRDKLIEGGLPAGKIAIIPAFAPDPGGVGGARGDFVLFAGRLSEEKGVATLLSAWDRLNGLPLRLKVVGDGPLREEVARRSAKGRFEYLGPLSREKVQALMREAALLVFPSLCFEAFGMAIIEAFSVGLPVIASNVGSMASLVDDGRTGLHFRPGDAEDLATKIEWSAAHPEELAKMRRESRSEYLAKYTPERNYEMLMDLYDNVISSNVSAKPEFSHDRV